MHHKPVYILILLGIIILDQWTKWYVFETLLRTQGTSLTLTSWLVSFQSLPETLASYPDFQVIKVTSFFNLVAVWNAGVSFGLFQQAGDLMPYILSVFAFCVGIFVLIWGFKSTHPVERLSMVLIAAGAFGNLWDRIRFKAVADFLDFHVHGYHWPAFNVADASITLGAALLIVYIICLDHQKD